MRAASKLIRWVTSLRRQFSSGPDLTRVESVLLVITVGIDGLLITGMAFRDFYLTKSAASTLGSGFLLVIGGINLLALAAFAKRLPEWQYAFLKHMPGWITATVAGQLLVIVFAGYVILMDVRSPNTRVIGVSGIAATLGLLALMWVLRLGRFAKKAFTKGVAVIAALVPLLGLFQYWLETDYIPRTSRPRVDINLELEPLGSTGNVIHLSAKVTLHNRSNVQVNAAGSVMRVTGFPRSAAQQWAHPHAVASAIDMSGINMDNEFRVTPTRASDSTLLYADDFLVAGAFLVPGETWSAQRVIDVDSKYLRLIRLSAMAVMVTDRRVQDVRTCGVHPLSLYDKNTIITSEDTMEHDSGYGGHDLCMDTEFAPRNVIQELVFDQPVLRTYVVIDEPYDVAAEYPLIFMMYGTPSHLKRWSVDPRTAKKIEDANPAGIAYGVAEYAPSDADVGGKK